MNHNIKPPQYGLGMTQATKNMTVQNSKIRMVNIRSLIIILFSSIWGFRATLALALIFSLNAQPALAAITVVGNLITTGCVEQSADTSLGCTTTVQLDADNLALCVFASDNQFNGTGTEVSTIQDEHPSATIDGNSMTKILEAASDVDGTSNNGGTVSVWLYRALSNIASSSALVFNLTNSKTAKAAICKEIGVTAGNTLESTGTPQTGAYDSADIGSLQITGLSGENLCLRAIAHEGDDAGGMTETASWLEWSIARSQDLTGAAGMVARAESFIFTGTDCTSDPAKTGDLVTLLVALKEVSVAGSIPAGVLRRRGQ